MNNKEERNEKFEVTYNGKPYVLSYEQMVVLAQKGMNYDKLYEKLEKMQNEYDDAKIYKEKVGEIAKELSITPEALLKSLDREKEEAGVRDYSEKNNIPVEYARVIKELQNKIGALEKEKEELTPIKRKQDELLNFKKFYPEIDERDIDPEIIKEWEKGERSLYDIYNERMYRKMLEDKNAKIANEENKKAALGSAVGSVEGEKTYTDEDIRNMSDKEFTKNFKDILKHLNKGDR